VTGGSGAVQVLSYQDVYTGLGYTSIYDLLHGSFSGGSGLGSESDNVEAAGTNYYFSDSHEAHVPVAYSFVYDFAGGGDSYTGTVVDDGRWGYTAGQTVAVTSGGATVGNYSLTALGGATALDPGTVTVTSYYSSEKAASFTPATGLGDGLAGLGSESDSIAYHGSLYGFAATASTSLPANGLWDFEFLYDDGSYFTGTVADDGSEGYSAGFTLGEVAGGTTIGAYTITAAAGSTTQPVGAVSVTLFHSAAEATDYAPIGGGGTAGLGSEDVTLSIAGSTVDIGGIRRDPT
jgi:hypothetical protein